jgi:hypothetical protein
MMQLVRALFLSTFWWWMAVLAFVLGYATYVNAERPEEMEIRAALDQNFEAYNREDVPAMMATLSPTLPRRDEFAQQSAALFRDNDAYISVLDFELLEVRGQYAVARVIQGTTTRDDAPEPTPEEAFYREHSKLLPSEAETEYVQGFKKERGKWRLWLVMTQPRKPFVGYTDDGVYHGPNAAEINRRNGVKTRSHCPGGNCSFPRIRVTAQ